MTVYGTAKDRGGARPVNISRENSKRARLACLSSPLLLDGRINLPAAMQISGPWRIAEMPDCYESLCIARAMIDSTINHANELIQEL